MSEDSVRLANPVLPPFLDDLAPARTWPWPARGSTSALSRAAGDVTTAVTRRHGKAQLVIVK